MIYRNKVGRFEIGPADNIFSIRLIIKGYQDEVLFSLETFEEELEDLRYIITRALANSQ